MNFELSAEHGLFGEQMASALTQAGAIAETRRLLDEPRMASLAWACVRDMGALGCAVPERFGGSGRDTIAMCVAAEQLGRALASGPVPSTWLAMEALLTFGMPHQREEWLPRLASGAVVGTVALPPLACTAARPTLSVDAGRLTGQVEGVPDGLEAAICIIMTRDREGCPHLRLVELDQVQIERRAEQTLDVSRPSANITFRAANADPMGPASSAMIERLRDVAVTLAAFEQLGGAERALELACEYANIRTAFGRQIGSNQAIKHKLARVFAANQIARAHAYHAAWAMAQDDTALALAAPAARIAATAAFVGAAQENIQTHGGIGYTWESDCHLFYRRARLLALRFGPARLWKLRLTARLAARSAPPLKLAEAVNGF
jgi:acyl-CoA dehydrogenase